MTCASCGSMTIEEFESEITIHFPEMKNIDNRPVLVFAKLSVCLICGKTYFVVPQFQLRQLSSDSQNRNNLSVQNRIDTA